jgi:thiol-disulfide isomerase/thioredoxin
MSNVSKRWRSILLAVAWIGSFVVIGNTRPSHAADAPAPATQPADESPDQPINDLRQFDLLNNRVHSAFVGKDLSKEADRRALAGQVIPLLRQEVEVAKACEETIPQMKPQFEAEKVASLARLYLLGDAATITEADRQAAGSDTKLAVTGKGVQITAAILVAGKNVEAQQKAVDQLVALDKANPADSSLTMLSYMLSIRLTPNLKQRLVKTIIDDMNNPLADRLKGVQDPPAGPKQLENKPLVVSGKTVDGKDFSSGQYQGKVVLVDFWATWCGPCCEETPRIKALYSKYHDKGLEVVGVSNDIEADALTKYIAKNQMPWPQLFNAESAAQRKPNPITVGYGITGIPVMFLIDRAGVLRTTDARELMEKMVPELLAESGTPASPVQTPASQPSSAEHGAASAQPPAISEAGKIPLSPEIVMMRAVGKPLVITGKQPDGKTFSTADWKGKVILVDFWGTWCGPCLEELPRVKKMYSQYHGQGLEVIGVDNDASAEALTSFLQADPKMPWPQLFDAEAAKKLKFNSIAMGLGVESIPFMFLIDKKGVLRSVTGRSDMEKVIPELLAE